MTDKVKEVKVGKFRSYQKNLGSALEKIAEAEGLPLEDISSYESRQPHFSHFQADVYGKRGTGAHIHYTLATQTQSKPASKPVDGPGPKDISYKF